MNDTTTRCPHCGAVDAQRLLLSMPPKRVFECGSYDGCQSAVCIERSARQKAEGTLQIMENFYKAAMDRAEKAEAEVARLNRIIEWSADLMAETGREQTAQKIRTEVYNPTHFKL